MRLADIVGTSERVRATRSRKQKIGHLAELLAGRSADEVRIVVSWLSGVMPQGRIGVGYSTVFKAAETPAAEASSLSMGEVDASLTAIAGTSGPGSKKAKEEAVRGLLAAATEVEQRFLRGLLTGELRQGALAGIMADGIAAATAIDAAVVRRAAMLSGDLAKVAVAAYEGGEAALAEFAVTLFQPLQPMLAHTAEDASEALARLGEAAFEVKLDGARVQAHKDGDVVRVFTRRLKEVTRAVPEVVEVVGALDCDDVILDGEVMALKPDGTPHPFQTTMRRFGRKLEQRVASLRDELPLTPFFFDVLRLDGRELIDAPMTERYAAMEAVVPAAHLAGRIVTADAEEASAFVAQAIADGHEGVMAKQLDAPYEAGSRGFAWLKIKPAHTLDLVVLACDWGSGRRKGWLSNLHLGARDPSTGGFVMLGKTFKGMTDEILRWQTETFPEYEVRRTDWTVFLRPEIVVEIAFNEVQASPRYDGGLALRHARVKAYRPDKGPEDADTIETVRAIHEGRIRPLP